MAYAFIDAANLFYGGEKSLGWKIDYKKLSRYLKRARFYRKLERFGYVLKLKPTKTFHNGGKTMTKANCDVDLTLDLMRLMSQYDEIVILSGDGDFAPVLEYLRKKGKKLHFLARSERTAKEIRRLAGDKFMDFNYLREILKMEIKRTPI